MNVVVVLWGARPQPTGGAVVDEWAFFEAVSDALLIVAARLAGADPTT